MAELNPDEEHRRECLARHMLHNWTFAEIRDWLTTPKRTEAYREDMRLRLNRLRQENHRK